MNYYIDIRIEPDNEMRENFLLNMVYTKFHKALCDLKSINIGVSFPEKKLKLGCLLRIHGSQEKLSKLMNLNWLGKLQGYCVLGEVLPVPANVHYRTVSRWQSNMSQSNFRRLVKHGSIKETDVKAYKAKMMRAQLTELPYLELESSSNGHRHRRYIQFSELQNKPIEGEFNHFGLSKVATIPWF